MHDGTDLNPHFLFLIEKWNHKTRCKWCLIVIIFRPNWLFPGVLCSIVPSTTKTIFSTPPLPSFFLQLQLLVDNIMELWKWEKCFSLANESVWVKTNWAKRCSLNKLCSMQHAHTKKERAECQLNPKIVHPITYNIFFPRHAKLYERFEHETIASHSNIEQMDWIGTILAFWANMYNTGTKFGLIRFGLAVPVQHARLSNVRNVNTHHVVIYVQTWMCYIEWRWELQLGQGKA